MVKPRLTVNTGMRDIRKKTATARVILPGATGKSAIKRGLLSFGSAARSTQNTFRVRRIRNSYRNMDRNGSL